MSWVSPLLQLVNFNQTYSRPTIFARKNGGIVSGRDGHNHGRLKVIERCKRTQCSLSIDLICCFKRIPSFTTAW